MKKFTLLLFTVAAFIGLNAQSLIFSEYIEGSSNNKALEIYNATDAVVDLSEYAFPNVSNAPTTPGEYEFWNTFTEGATIEPGGVYVIAHSSADPAILAQADQLHDYLSNGDDGYALVKGTESDFVIIDKIGTWDADPGAGWDVAGVTNATQNHTLVRKDSVTVGETDWTISAGTDSANSGWLVKNENDFSFLGWHITPPNNEANILGFVLAEELETAMISIENAQVTSTVFWGTDLTALTPEITVSAGAQISPTTGTVQDFTNSVEYLVTAEDKSTKLWTVTVIVAPEPDVTTIHDIQFTEDASGDSPFVGEIVKTSGIVTGLSGNGFFVQDGAGEWNGVWVYSPDEAANVSVGDDITLIGSVDEYYNLTEIVDIISLTVNSSSNTLPEATVSTIANIGESLEGVLVSVESVTCTAEADDHNEWQVTDANSDVLFVDDALFAYTPAIDDVFEKITGCITYSFEAYKLLPRSTDDLIIVSIDNQLAAVSMYPNPVNNQLLIENLDGVDQVIISNILGQKVFAKEVSDSKMRINTTEFRTGAYIVTVISKNGLSYAKKLIKE